MNRIFSGTLLTGILMFLFACEEHQFHDVMIAPYPDDKKLAVSLTFDDGCYSVFEKVVPILDSYGHKATFFVNPATIKESDWHQWRQLNGKGYEIGNHTMSHRDLTLLDSAEAILEIADSKLLLQEKLGISIYSFAHPYHRTNPEVERIVRQHHQFSRLASGFCKWYGWTSRTTWDFFIHDFNKAYKNGDWLVPSIHGVGDCWEPISESFFKRVLAHIDGRKEDIAIETFGNIARYKAERDHAVVSVSESPSRRTITITCDLDPGIYDYPLTVVVRNHLFADGFKVRSMTNQPLSYYRRGADLLIKTIPNTTIEISWP